MKHAISLSDLNISKNSMCIYIYIYIHTLILPSSSSCCSFFSPLFFKLSSASIFFCIISMSFCLSSDVIIFKSSTGSTRSSTCTTSLSSKQRHTWRIPSTARIFDKNALPSPAPWLAPFTSPVNIHIPKNNVIYCYYRKPIK